MDKIASLIAGLILGLILGIVILHFGIYSILPVCVVMAFVLESSIKSVKVVGGAITIGDKLEHKKNDTPLDVHLTRLLAAKSKPLISHLLPDAKDAGEFSRLLDLSKRKKYEDRGLVYKPVLHWGQLKLFLSEVEFLTLATQTESDLWFVYAGAAPGNHIGYLAELFPNVHFELYDPNDFVVKNTPMITTHVQFFTDSDAKYWADSGKTVVFCSDIRSEPATPENINRNMKMQLEWWRIIKPWLAMFKFRLPWEPGQTEYPEGDIYIQAYPGPTSSETRLVCKRDAKLKVYDNTEYEDACYYHNTVTRQMRYKTEGLVLDDCYDCASFEFIMREYLKIAKAAGSSKANMKLAKLIKEVENQITQGQTVRSNTQRQINTELDQARRSQWQKCGNAKCSVCLSGLKERKYNSKATIENELKT